MDYYDVNFNNDFVYHSLVLLFINHYKLGTIEKFLTIEIDKNQNEFLPKKYNLR